jgi:hypothetical protein
MSAGNDGRNPRSDMGAECRNPENMYVVGGQQPEIMAKRPVCDHCGKDAIGFQSLEGAFEYVCGDHADGLLLALSPGEKKVYGVCVLERYP